MLGSPRFPRLQVGRGVGNRATSGGYLTYNFCVESYAKRIKKCAPRRRGFRRRGALVHTIEDDSQMALEKSSTSWQSWCGPNVEIQSRGAIFICWWGDLSLQSKRMPKWPTPLLANWADRPVVCLTDNVIYYLSIQVPWPVCDFFSVRALLYIGKILNKGPGLEETVSVLYLASLGLLLTTYVEFWKLYFCVTAILLNRIFCFFFSFNFSSFQRKY